MLTFTTHWIQNMYLILSIEIPRTSIFHSILWFAIRKHVKFIFVWHRHWLRATKNSKRNRILSTQEFIQPDLSNTALHDHHTMNLYFTIVSHYPSIRYPIKWHNVCVCASCLTYFNQDSTRACFNIQNN